MLSKYLKKTLVFSVVSAGIFLFVLSCENPFSTSLGAKVDVEYPTVTIQDPVVGSFVKGSVQFTGSAAAYRELRKVEVRILDPKADENAEDTENALPPLMDWTEVPTSGGTKEKTWTFNLDTVNFNGQGLEDGFLKLQFRASDPNLTAQSVVSVFIVKNKPSIIKMTAPALNQLVDRDNQLILTSPSAVGTGTDLLGNVIDRRGIKPGYPRIKFWPENLAINNPEKIDPATGEPFDDDEDWGWAQLFLSGIDSYEDDYGNAMVGDYMDRTDMPVVNAGNFSFKLANYTIDKSTRQIKYTLEGGNFVPLQAGIDYRFKIITSDTFFDEAVTVKDKDGNDIRNDYYMYPVAPPSGEQELIGHLPDPADPALADTPAPLAYKIKLVTTGTVPTIEIDNADVADELDQVPNIYINKPTDKKILVDSVYRDTLSESDWATRKNFRLRVKAMHDGLIAKATLRWEHTAGKTFRSGNLMWDDIGSDGYVDPTNDTTKAEEGHRGALKTPGREADGRIFEFTGLGKHVEFISSTEPYTLIVKADSNDGSYTEQKYTLYLDGDGPTVTVSSIRGASAIPNGEAVADGKGRINNYEYIVNGNIQVLIDRTANMGIIAEKWVIEDKLPADPTSTLTKLRNYRTTPTAANLKFFDDIKDTESTAAAARNGHIYPAFKYGNEFKEDAGASFKVNVDQFKPNPVADKELWLYAIIQDEVYNLGYIAQKLILSDSTDTPTLELFDLQAGTGYGQTELFISATATEKTRKNVLGRGSGIAMKFTDDDAIRPKTEDVTVTINGVPKTHRRNGGITITLTEMNTNRTATITPTKMIEGSDTANFTVREWNNVLSQTVMAEELYGKGTNIPTYLEDGLYRIAITIEDDPFSKVYFDIEDLPAKKGTGDKTFFFIVYSQPPRIIFDNPAQNNEMRDGSTPIHIHGRVVSRVRIQGATISFAPDITAAAPGGNDTSVSAALTLPLYANRNLSADGNTFTPVGQAITMTGTNWATAGLVTDQSDPNYGSFVYYWYRNPPVSFGNTTASAAERKFEVYATDGLAEQSNEERYVKIDNNAPSVGIAEFNFSRVLRYMDAYLDSADSNVEYIVNGKVPIVVSATDAEGSIKLDAAGNPMVKWFILPKGSAAPNWNTNPTGNGRSGTFTANDNVGSGKYQLFINTASTVSTPRDGFAGLPKGNYELYVIAEDTAGNRNAPVTGQPLQTFKVDQDSDKPYLWQDNNMKPRDGGYIGADDQPIITGRISDDDGFSPLTNRLNTYVSIRFRNADGSIWGVGQSQTNRTWTGPGPNNTTISYVADATTGWIPIRSTRVATGVSAGDIEYLFTFDTGATTTTAKHPYFREDGDKYYQIMVTDEPTAGTAVDSRGNPDPRGKNPVGSENKTPTLNARTVYYPKAGKGEPDTGIDTPLDGTNVNNWFTFMIKVNPPVIKFNLYNIEDGDTGRTIPVYSNTTNLLNDLQSGTITDRSLNDASYSYNGVNIPLTKYGYNDTTAPGIRPNNQTAALVDMWTWRLNIGALGAAAGANPTTNPATGWYAAGDGLHTITVRATDTLGKPGFKDWTFYKDTTGPDITFDVIKPDNPSVAISGAAGTTLYVRGGFNDLYSNLADSFEYQLYRKGATRPSTWSTQVMTLNGTRTNKTGTYGVVAPPAPSSGTPSFDNATYPDGPYIFRVRVSDNPAQSTNTQNQTTTDTLHTNGIEFIVDRQLPQMVVAADDLRVINNQLKNLKTGAVLPAGTMAESDRVFSASTADAPANGTTKVFTLSGIVYEHNLSELRVSLRNDAALVTHRLTGINGALAAWKNATRNLGTESANYTGYFGSDGTTSNGIGTDGVTTANSIIRVRRATQADLTAFGLPSGNDTLINFRYVWEVDIRNGDFRTLANASNLDTTNRSISVTAYDLAGGNTGAQNWPFKLDINAPTITFTNLSPTAATTLEDQSVVLQVQISDTSDIQSVKYKIEKYAHSGATWPTFAAPIGTGTWNSVTGSDDNGFKPWNDFTPARILNLRISDTTAIPTGVAGDGLYRVTIKAADGSLSAINAGGNEATLPTSNPTVGHIFYVDRNGPVLGLGTTAGFYKLGTSVNVNSATDSTAAPAIVANQIIFDRITAADINVISGATGALGGTLTGPAASKFTVTVTNNSTANSTANPTTLRAVIELNGGQTINAATDNGNYTLTLNVQDHAGVKTQSGNTISFYMDNAAPTIGMSVVGRTVVTEAITGRVEFQAQFGKPSGSSQIRRVAYKVDTGAATVPGDLTDAGLAGAGWYFNNGATTGNRYKIWVNDSGNGLTPTAPTVSPTGKGLIEINEGLAVANLTLYNTSRLVTHRANIASLLGSATSATSGTFNGINIAGNTVYPNTNVHDLRISILAIDEVGNANVQSFNYSVYPAGDYPIVTQVINPNESESAVNRRLNGSITISGKATDNYRVGRVWFRVLKGTDTTGATMNIPKWDSNWNALTINGATQFQTVESKTPQGGTASNGWYMANGGGTKEVSWWAQINTNGELDPTTTNEQGITIQVIVEDALFDDATGEDTVHYVTTPTNNPTGWTSTGTNLFSSLKQVAATVVTGAPTFAEEKVKAGASAGVDHDSPLWESVLASTIRGRASYQVTVKHLSGVGAIRWTNAPTALSPAVTASTNLLDYYDAGSTYRTTYNTHITNIANNNQGIAVKAEPKNPITNTSLAAGTYMVWTWGAALGGQGGLPASNAVPAPTTDNQRGTIFTTTAAITNIGTAVVLPRVTETVDGVNRYVYEWLVTVDINSATLVDPAGGTFSGKAKHYNVELQATDNSKPNPIMGRKTAQVPIDNIAPGGLYSHSTNIAGTAQTFGGEAGDTEGDVKGLSRVVMWLSRNVPNVGEVSIVWNKKAYQAGDFQGMTTNPSATEVVDIGKLSGTYAAVRVPNMTFLESNATEDNGSYIVIDRHDPQGRTAHHGHKLSMGFAPTSGALGTSWYVALDSTLIESGRVTAHYIVYDKAGNGRYYNQRLMILNGVPKIERLTLATDIYGANSSLNLTAAGTLGGTGNRTYGTGALTVTTNNVSAIARIKTRYEAFDPNAATNAARGISDEIVVDTSKPGIYNVVDVPDFIVRNNLFAVKVDTTVGQAAASEKQRNYRVEYVANVRTIAGANLIARSTTSSQSGIRAGKVYIINDPGTNFPWGVLGVQGEHRRGTAFLAMVDGNEIDLVATSGTAFTNAYGNPSVWELNGSYYGTTGVTDANVLNRTVTNNLRFNNNNNDVVYQAPQNGGTQGGGLTAEFVYQGTTTFTDTADSTTAIRNFAATNTTTGDNLDEWGMPKPYPANAMTATGQTPHILHSLFIVRVFDGPETELFGDFALLSVRVNNNDVTPPYAQLYDMNPNTEEAALADALDPLNIGDNRLRGGLYRDGSDKSGHIEPRKTTSLTGPEMSPAGTTAAGSIIRPAANAAAFFETDTVSGDVIVRGYAEDNQRVARVDLEFWSTDATPVRRGADSITILARDTTTGNNNLLQSPIAARVKWKETVDLNRHRVEWSYRWSSEDLPYSQANNTTPLVVGNINVRAVAYNANSTVTAANNTPVDRTTAAERTYMSPLIAWPFDNTAGKGRNFYDSFNPGFPAGAGTGSNDNNFNRYNQIRVNIRPYITGFLRDQSQSYHNERSRQGRYILRRGETPAITGFNIGGSGTTNIRFSLRNVTSGAITTQTRAAGAINSDNQRNNYVVNTAHRNLPSSDRIFTTRYRVFNSALENTAATAAGKIELSVGNFSAVNTEYQAGGESAASIRPLINGKPVVQPWNKEYSRSKEGSELWDDYIMIHIWQSNDNSADTAGTVDNGRFRRLSQYNINYPSMSMNPNDGSLWASHQSGGNLPRGGVGTGGASVAYPGGGTYISSNDGSTYGVLRQVASFSEHMADTNIYVSAMADGAQTGTIWAMSNIITKAHSGSSWSQAGGLWLWGPIANTTSNNGNPRIFNGPRTIGENTGSTTRGSNPSAFLFPGSATNTYGTSAQPAPSQTGHYGVETQWYNGSESSRSGTVPQNLEQFKNPHIVTYNDNGTERVHVAYFDAKDGSIKYRYNTRGNTGTVDSQSMTRNWVNLDGGADVDDNAVATGAPGSAAMPEQNYSEGTTNVAVRVGGEAAVVLAGGNNQAYPETTGATSVETTRTGGTGNLTAVLVQNGQYVTANTPVYTIGGAAVNAGTAGFIVLNYPSVPSSPSINNNDPLFRVYPLVTNNTSRIVTTGNDRTFPTTNVSGRHNAIAVTGSGLPVIAYYDETRRQLKLAVARTVNPTTAENWRVVSAANIFTGTDSTYMNGTGEYVSIQIDGNTVHIAAMNALTKNLVYIKGTLDPANNTLSSIFTKTIIQVVDSVGNVGSWCKLSLDKDGNPWIAYMDEGYRGSKDGVKVAYYVGDTARDASYKYPTAAYRNQDTDVYGKSIAGWEAMHVATDYRVENAELGMERFPSRRVPDATRSSGLGSASVVANRVGFTAVGYLGQDYYRIAYYVE